MRIYARANCRQQQIYIGIFCCNARPLSTEIKRSRELCLWKVRIYIAQLFQIALYVIRESDEYAITLERVSPAARRKSYGRDAGEKTPSLSSYNHPLLHTAREFTEKLYNYALITHTHTRICKKKIVQNLCACFLSLLRNFFSEAKDRIFSCNS